MANKYEDKAKKSRIETKRLRSCERKKKYKTREDAEKRNNRVYKCEFCNQWHTSAAFNKLVRRLNRQQSGLKSSMDKPLSRKSYKQVIKNLGRFRSLDRQKRPENHVSVPIDWKNSLLEMVEKTVLGNNEYYSREIGERTLKCLKECGKLVMYNDGYTFPSTKTPTK